MLLQIIQWDEFYIEYIRCMLGNDYVLILLLKRYEKILTIIFI